MTKSHNVSKSSNSAKFSPRKLGTIMKMIEPEYLAWRRTPMSKRRESYMQFRDRVGGLFGLSRHDMNHVVHIIRYREVAIKRRAMAGELALKVAVEQMPVTPARIARLAAASLARRAAKAVSAMWLGGQKSSDADQAKIPGGVSLA